MKRYALAVRSRIVILDAATDIAELKNNYIDFDAIGLACAPADCNDTCPRHAAGSCSYRLIRDDHGRYWHLHDDDDNQESPTKTTRRRR